MEKFRNSRDRFDRRRIPGKLMLANGEAQITESSSTGDRLHFSALPGEIKNKIYRLLLIAKEVKRAVKNRAPSYDFNTAILQVSRQFHNEAGGILYLENTFIRVTTTSGRLQQAVSDNFLPIISMGSCTSDNFPTQALQVQVHLSPKPILLECGEQCTFLITLEELPAFCTVLWLCCCLGQELGS